MLLPRAYARSIEYAVVKMKDVNMAKQIFRNARDDEAVYGGEYHRLVESLVDQGETDFSR